ncbi:MAG: BrnT family toxin [Pyrinomonadaceae bacterium]
MSFDWDKEKAETNFKKHSVSFEEAKTVWDDYFYIDLFDEKHSVEENRFLIVGESAESRLLIVSYTERENSIRIISARELTPKERRDYEHGHFE